MTEWSDKRCLWCDAAMGAAEPLAVREMMFGTRARHRVARCGACGSTLLLDPPADLSSAYPSDYYSLGTGAPFEAPDNAKRRLMRAVSAALLRLPPRLADRLLARASFDYVPFRWLAGRGAGISSSILDVGSGDGFLLKRLALMGFRHLLGVDPHLRNERDGLPELRRAELGAVEGTFDVIMLHHVLEHLPDPAETLRLAGERLASGGTIVARVPLADSWAARRYGADWIALDAPRHLAVPTEAGFRRCAERAGLRVDRGFRDSDSIQFWGSEQYVLDIPLDDPRSIMRGEAPSPFGDRQLRLWRAQARRLNRAGDGDSGCFLLSPPG